MRFQNGFNNSNIQEPLRMPCTGAYNGMTQMGYPQQMTQGTLPGMPTGFPTGGTTTPLLPAMNGTPAYPVGDQIPATVKSTLFTPGFLRTQIGKRMRVEFLIGTGTLIDRTGTLLNVGASYILLQMVDSDDIMMCDIYSIKFVTILL